MNRWVASIIALALATILNVVGAFEGTAVTHAPAVITPIHAIAAPPESTSKAGEGAKASAGQGKAVAAASLTTPAPHHVSAPGESEDAAELPPTTRDELVWLRFGFIEALLIGAGLLWALTSLKTRAAFNQPGTTLLFIAQLIIMVFGLIAALVHATWVTPDAAGRYVPNLDSTTFLWSVLIVVGALLPRLQKIGFAGAEVEITAEKATAVTNDIATLMENWIRASNVLMTWLETDQDPTSTIIDFLRDRGDEALQEMVLPGEYLRLSFWNFSESVGGLKLLQSNQIHDKPTLEKVFRVSEGCLGMAYREDRVWNEADPKSLGCWIKIDGSSNEYNGLLLVPIVWKNQKLGMLAIDRTSKSEFPDISVSIARSLADLAASALGSPAIVVALRREAESAIDGDAK